MASRPEALLQENCRQVGVGCIQKAAPGGIGPAEIDRRARSPPSRPPHTRRRYCKQGNNLYLFFRYKFYLCAILFIFPFDLNCVFLFCQLIVGGKGGPEIDQDASIR